MTLPEVVKAHPYLFTNILSLGLVLIFAIHLRPAYRRLILRLGLIMMLSSAFAVLFEREYWHPIRAGGWALGIEDLLFTFNFGALGCLPTIWFFRRNLVVAEQPAPKMKRLLAVGMMSLCWLTVLWILGLSNATSMFLAQIMAAVSLLLPRFDLWALSLANGAGFTLLYCLILRTYFWIWPDLVSYWSTSPPWGLLWFGIPLGEIAWAFSFGLFWLLFAGFVFDIGDSHHNPQTFRKSSTSMSALGVRGLW